MCIFLNYNARGFVWMFAALLTVAFILESSVQVYVDFLKIYLGISLQLDLFPVFVKPRVSNEGSIPVIVWWNNFTGQTTRCRTCGKVKCWFTDSRTFRPRNVKGYLFYGSKINLTDLPLPRDGGNKTWALFHEESPKNMPALSHEPFLQLFNYSATFSRFSDVPLTLQHVCGDLLDIGDTLYFFKTEYKDQIISTEGFAPVLYIQSGCNTPSQRDEYVKELMKFISVDSYGACLHNKELPPMLQDVRGYESPDFFRFVARYKFTLAFENAICNDYITEKLWRPLIAGSVPVYMGSPTVKDWLPHRNSVILVSDFNSPKDLASYLHELNRNPEKYEAYLPHKLESSKADRVPNTRFLKTFVHDARHAEGIIEFPDYVYDFECFVCQRIHNKSIKSVTSVNETHYDCPVPVSPLTRTIDPNNFWFQVWNSGKCEAIAVRNFADHGKSNFSNEELQQEVSRLMKDKKCYVW